MGTAISCTECSQVAGLIQESVETPRKHRHDFHPGVSGQLLVMEL